MIKDLFNKNKKATVSLLIAIGVFCLFVFLNVIPVTNRYGLDKLFSLTIEHCLVFLATILCFVSLAIDNPLHKKFIMVIPFAILSLFYFGSWLFYLIASIKFNNDYLAISIINLFLCITFIVLLISKLLKKPHVSNYLGIGLAFFSILSYFVCYLILYSDFFNPTGIDYVALIFFVAMYVCFFLGYAYSIKFKKDQPINPLLHNQLAALKVKYEVGSISEEEYVNAKKELLKNI